MTRISLQDIESSMVVKYVFRNGVVSVKTYYCEQLHHIHTLPTDINRRSTGICIGESHLDMAGLVKIFFVSFQFFL